MGRLRLVLAASATCVLAVSAGSCQTQGKDCTLLGADSGVLVTFDDVKKVLSDERLTAEACADDECTTQTVRTGQNATGLSLLVGKPDDATPVEITLRITDDEGGTLFDGAATVSPVKNQPNGEGCEPTVWSAQVEAVGTSELREHGSTRTDLSPYP